jgi:hypothetical protein
MHSTSNLKDGYLGSGKRLHSSIRKYGIKNFSIEILEYKPDRESLAKRELEIVNEDFLKNPFCMNLIQGGTGFSIESSKIAKGKFFEKLKDPDFKKFLSEKASESNNRKSRGLALSQEKAFRWPIGTQMARKIKDKISSSKKGNCSDVKNSQYGTVWITRNNENKKIKIDLINQYLTEGWIKGRFIKRKSNHLEQK